MPGHELAEAAAKKRVEQELANKLAAEKAEKEKAQKDSPVAAKNTESVEKK